MTAPVLSAANGLSLHLDEPHWRIAWTAADWWGPLCARVAYAGRVYNGGAGQTLPAPELHRFDGRDVFGSFTAVELRWPQQPLPLVFSARAYAAVPLLVFRAEASAPISGLANGVFAEPSVAWPAWRPDQRVDGGAPSGTRAYGHQYTEFALPVSGDGQCTGFRFAPHRPPVVEPLMLIAPDGRTLMLAALDQFHEQIIAVPAQRERVGDGVRCGWHGDLDRAPAGFASECAVVAAETPRRALDAWGAMLRQRYATQRPSRYADDGVGRLSYWTDNGAVYYYRTEPEADYSTTLARVMADLDAHAMPVCALQIDSWFYPHEHLRPVSSTGAPIVPPSGLMTWEPRADLFPHGWGDLRARVGRRPLIFHSRHFASRSPYCERYDAWHDGDRAHPSDPAFYDMLMEQAASWGAITYEQDWMVESFLGVRGLREEPGRARAWQEQLDRSAGAHGLTLQWCMSTPADFAQTVTLRHLTSIRTSGDYRYLFDNGLNWVWFLQTNALARALGLNPFKDVFISHGPTTLSTGEPHAEAEALLAALSAGPVGIGDQRGCSERELVLRTCREDGVLVKPDVPLAALDRCFYRNGFFEPQLLTGVTHSAHPAGRWLYVASFNAYRGKERLQGRIDLADLGEERPQGPLLAYDWRQGAWTRLEADGGWGVSLDFQDWDLRILCPLLAGGVTIFGDVGKYATAGDRRIRHIAADTETLRFDVLGVEGAIIEVHGYATTTPRSCTVWEPGTRRALPSVGASSAAEGWRWDAADGRWIIRVAVGARGWTGVEVALK